MTDLLWLSDDQLDRIKPYFPLSHGVPRVDDHRVVSGIVFVIKNGLRWRDAPREYGPHRTLYNRFIRWSRMGIFDRIFASLAGRSGQPDRLLTIRHSTKSVTRSKIASDGSKIGGGSQRVMTGARTPSSQAFASPPALSSICVNES